MVLAGFGSEVEGSGQEGRPQLRDQLLKGISLVCEPLAVLTRKAGRVAGPVRQLVDQGRIVGRGSRKASGAGICTTSGPGL